MRFDREGLLELVREGVAHNASDLLVRVGGRPSMRIDGALSPSRFPRVSSDDAARLVGELVRVSGVGGSASAPGRSCFVVELSERDGTNRRVRVQLMRGRAGWGVQLHLIPSQVPRLEELSVPRALGEVTRGGGVTLLGGSRRRLLGASLVQACCQERPLSAVTIESPVEYLVEAGESWVVQRELGSDLANVRKGVDEVRGEVIDLLYVGGDLDQESVIAAFEVASEGVSVVLAVRSGSAEEAVETLLRAIPSTDQRLQAAFERLFRGAHALGPDGFESFGVELEQAEPVHLLEGRAGVLQQVG